MSRILVVVDMQNDFVDGALGTPEAVKIIEPMQKRIEEFLKAGDEVVFTKDTHYEDYLETAEGKKLPIPHCIHGTEGWEICPALKEYSENTTVFEKATFGSVRLAHYLASHSYDEVWMAGLCTDICVISNALLAKVVIPETEIIVDSKCCAGVTKESHANALEAMKMCQITIA